MDNDTKSTSTELIPLGIGIAIGAGLLIILIELWPLMILAAAGYCIYKGVNST
jgi:hypothetical protein